MKKILKNKRIDLTEQPAIGMDKPVIQTISGCTGMQSQYACSMDTKNMKPKVDTGNYATKRLVDT